MGGGNAGFSKPVPHYWLGETPVAVRVLTLRPVSPWLLGKGSSCRYGAFGEAGQPIGSTEKTAEVRAARWLL